MPQSQAAATLPRVPSVRGTSFHPVPLHNKQFSRAICRRWALAQPVQCKAYEHAHLAASFGIRETCGRLAATAPSNASMLLALSAIRRSRLLAFSYGNSNNSRIAGHDSMALWALFISRRDARQLLLHDVRKLLHLALHLDHLFAHVQDDLDAREVHAHIASQRQDNVQAPQIAIGVKARIALRAWLAFLFASPWLHASLSE